jgi:nucleoside-diphosphate-sugar epimerase
MEGRVIEVIVVDNLSSGSRDNIPKDKRITFIKGDIAQISVLLKAFKKPVDVVFHLAAHFANQNSIDNPVSDLQSNGLGTLNLLELSRKNKVKKFVYFSTSCLYKSKNLKLKESELDLQFETPYAISKYVAEKYTQFFYHHYNMPNVILRIFNSFGPREVPGRYRNVIPNFIYRGIKNRSLIITGTGQETRNFTYVDDIVRGSILAAISKKAVGHTINIGSKNKTTIKDLANRVKELTGNTKPILYKSRRNWDNTTSRDGDLSLAEKLLGFRAKISVDDGLVKTCTYITNQIKSKKI